MSDKSKYRFIQQAPTQKSEQEPALCQPVVLSKSYEQFSQWQEQRPTGKGLRYLCAEKCKYKQA